MPNKTDYKKDEKALYFPPEQPVRIIIPEMKFFMISGTGNPNTSESFSEVVQALYSLSYTVKMSPKSGNAPEAYHEYTVYPLEGIWDMDDNAKDFSFLHKDFFRYTMMIRQPEFVSEQFALEILESVKKKKSIPVLADTKFGTIHEGTCVQMMHIGPYDSEPASFQLMESFMLDQGLSRITKSHREIYLSDPRRIAAEKMKTVLRCQVK